MTTRYAGTELNFPITASGEVTFVFSTPGYIAPKDPICLNMGFGKFICTCLAADVSVASPASLRLGIPLSWFLHPFESAAPGVCFSTTFESLRLRCALGAATSQQPFVAQVA